MRVYKKRTDLLKQSFVEGEVVEFDGKVCKVTISRGGSLNCPKVSVALVPVTRVTINEDTEIILNT